MLSHTAEYALRAVVHLAGAGTGPVRVGEIARELGLPQNYLSKTLSALVGAGVLDSVRGPRGGFSLARSADRISLAEVVAPFQDVGSRRACLLGLPVCSERTACAAHEAWKATAEHVATFFRTTTVGNLLRRSVALHAPARPRNRRAR